ncbi:MAG: DUF58 domain-containing protein [bacterium]
MTPNSSTLDDRGQPLFNERFLETLEYLHIIARKILSGQMKAERRSRKKGVSVEFADYRPYTPGDDYRFIDWNVFFRTDHLFLKLFEEEEDLTIYLLLDCSGSIDYGMPYKFHYLRRMAAAVGYLGLANLDRVCLVPFTNTLPESAAQTLPLRGKGKIFRLLRFLEILEAAGPTDLNACLRAFAGSKRKRGLAVVLSDLYDTKGVIPALNSLRYQKFEVFVIHCVSPQETDPELFGDLRLLDAETPRFRDVTLTGRAGQRYREAFDDYCGTIERYCRSRAIGYVRCRTDMPFEDTVVRMLRHEKFLQ